MKATRNVLHLMLAVCVFLAAPGCNPAEITEDDFEPISLAEVRAMTTGKEAARTLVVDPRLPEKYEAGHIPGARSLQLGELYSKTSKETLNPALREYKTIIVYGEDPGSRSARSMTQRLMVLDHGGVRIFWGGLAEWMRAGLAVDRGEAKK